MLLRRVIAHFRKQEWTAIALDFLIVVVGILLAFQITEWNEARKDRLREHVYLTRIAVELDESIASIRDAIRLAEQRGTLGELLIRAADNPAVVRADPGPVLLVGYRNTFLEGEQSEFSDRSADEIWEEARQRHRAKDA